jgi:hypothetical protein
MRSYFHSVFEPWDSSGGDESQFWDGEADFHGSGEGFIAGTRAFVATVSVSQVAAGMVLGLSHGEDWTELAEDWLDPGMAFVSTLAGCDTAGVLGTGADRPCGVTATGFADGGCTVEVPTTVSVPETIGFCGAGGTTFRGSRCCANARDVRHKVVTQTANVNK